MAAQILRYFQNIQTTIQDKANAKTIETITTANTTRAQLKIENQFNKLFI